MTIPKEVKNIISQLKAGGFEAYIVGGCVRDLLLALSGAEWAGTKPKDWDITTSARPDQIKKVFPDSFYENNFLTVTVRTDSDKEKLKEIEVTTFRSEATYSDKRHPDQVKYAKNLQEDLARRDFTVNAMAIEIPNNKSQITKVIDFFGGQEDLKAKIIKTVGNPD